MKFHDLLEDFFLPKLSQKDEQKLVKMLIRQSKLDPEQFEKSLAHINLIRRSEGLKPIDKRNLKASKSHDIADFIWNSDINDKPIKLTQSLPKRTSYERSFNRDINREYSKARAEDRLPPDHPKVDKEKLEPQSDFEKYYKKRKEFCVKCGERNDSGNPNFCRSCLQKGILNGRKIVGREMKRKS